MHKALFFAVTLLAAASAQAITALWTSRDTVLPTAGGKSQTSIIASDALPSTFTLSVVATLTTSTQNYTPFEFTAPTGSSQANNGFRVYNGNVGFWVSKSFTEAFAASAGQQIAFQVVVEGTSATLYLADNASHSATKVVTLTSEISTGMKIWYASSNVTLNSMAVYDAALTEAQRAEIVSAMDATVLPEPTALALLALGVAGVALRRRA